MSFIHISHLIDAKSGFFYKKLKTCFKSNLRFYTEFLFLLLTGPHLKSTNVLKELFLKLPTSLDTTLINLAFFANFNSNQSQSTKLVLQNV